MAWSTPLAGVARLADPRRAVRFRTFVWVALVVVALDQLSKLWVVAALFGEPPRVLIPHALQLIYAINTGAAWSMFEGHTRALGMVSVGISLLFIAWAWFCKREEQGLRPALGLIVGGALGNVIDRFRLGYVIDFVDVHWPWGGGVYHYPTFNVADSAVCIGMVLVLIAAFRPAPADASGAELPTAEPPNSDTASARRPAADRATPKQQPGHTP